MLCSVECLRRPYHSSVPGVHGLEHADEDKYQVGIDILDGRWRLVSSQAALTQHC